MRVAELRTILAGLPDDHLVVLAGDAEGNSFDVLAHTELCQTQDGWTEFPSLTGNVEGLIINAICLWPVR